MKKILMTTSLISLVLAFGIGGSVEGGTVGLLTGFLEMLGLILLSYFSLLIVDKIEKYEE